MHLDNIYSPTPPDKIWRQNLRGKYRFVDVVRTLCLFILIGGFARHAIAQDVSFPMPPGEASIQIRAEEGYQWQTGEYQVWHLNHFIGCREFPIPDIA